LKNIFSKISFLILCGGSGKRLRPVVSDRQKAMADVSGQPFITFILEQIFAAGGRDVILCTGFMGEPIESLLGKSYKGLSLRFSQETGPLGTAGAISNAKDLIKSDILMVFNGDSYCNINPQSLLEWHLGLKSLCTLLLVQVPDVSRYGRVNFDENYLITLFEEKAAGQGGGWINAGVYCMNRELISSIKENKNSSLENDLFPRMIGHRLFAFPQDVKFIDIGTPESYKEAGDFFSKIKKSAEA
jgi:NDP-sugar pyrophosphorylase family protein